MTIQELIDELAEFDGGQVVYIKTKDYWLPVARIIPDLSDGTVEIIAGDAGDL